MTPKVFNINRRRFIKSTFAIAAATGVPGWFLELEQAHAAQPKPLGPNDRPGIALVGCGGHGAGACGRGAPPPVLGSAPARASSPPEGAAQHTLERVKG